MSMKEVYYDANTQSVILVPRSNVDVVKSVPLPATAFRVGANNRGMVLVGAVMAWIPGYYTSSANTGYAQVLAVADTVASANSFLNPLGFAVCDGSALNDIDSPIWNATGRNLPNLTDSRFIQGSSTVGGTSQAGSNVLTDHTHAPGTMAVALNHTHADVSVYGSIGSTDGGHAHACMCVRNASASNGGGVSVATCTILAYDYTNDMIWAMSNSSGHGHTFSLGAYGQAYSASVTPTGNVGSGSAANLTNNLPKYLKCFYIVRFK